MPAPDSSRHPFDLAGKRVWVAGHRGMVGSALMRRLAAEGCELLTVTHSELDLRSQKDTHDWVATHEPEVVFLVAAKVGGIYANAQQPAEFLYDNLVIEANVIHSAHRCGIEKLLFLGSACIYPKLASQPIPEEALLSGPLEPTNEWYAIAKIAGIKLCQAYRKQYGRDFITAQPNNLYGPGDNFDLMSSHVIPAIMAKAHRAKVERMSKVEIWGTGNPLREFLHVDDLADALVFLMRSYSDAIPLNIGTGEEFSIRDLAQMICDVVGFRGELEFNPDMPDGTPRKLVDTSRMTALGWSPTRSLGDGLDSTYAWYLEHVA